jgi:hypothetical protein
VWTESLPEFVPWASAHARVGHDEPGSRRHPGSRQLLPAASSRGRRLPSSAGPLGAWVSVIIRRLAYGCDVASRPSESSHARDALLDEYRELARSIADQRERAQRLLALAEQATAHAEEQERSLRDLGELLVLDPQLRLEQLDARLRGQRLQEIAVQVLQERQPAGEPVHYKQWYALLREAGHAVGGKDPLATFLACLNRSPEVHPVGRRSGLYMVAGDGQRPGRGVRAPR